MWFESACLVVEVSQIIIHEADEPEALIGLFDTDGLVGEDLAEIDFSLFEGWAPLWGATPGWRQIAALLLIAATAKPSGAILHNRWRKTELRAMPPFSSTTR